MFVSNVSAGPARGCPGLKILGIIQARMESTRLPGKVLSDVGGRPLLHHVVRRACRARTIDEVIVATSDRTADDVIVRFCEAGGICTFRGSRDDVLDRYYRASLAYHGDVLVRLTADCPMLDPEVIDRVVTAFRRGTYDYVSNTLQCTYPDGLDTEVFRFAALEHAWRRARLRSEREHVTPYMRNHPELFRLGNVRHDRDLSHLRWTVDEPQDLEFVRVAYAHLGRHDFGMEDVVRLLRERPQLAEVNAGIQRDEGYRRSLSEDQILPGE